MSVASDLIKGFSELAEALDSASVTLVYPNGDAVEVTVREWTDPVERGAADYHAGASEGENPGRGEGAMDGWSSGYQGEAQAGEGFEAEFGEPVG